MSIFDGIGAIVNSVFGADVVITRQQTGIPVTVAGVFRFVLEDDPIADGRSLMGPTPVLRLPADLLPLLTRGDTVAPSEYPGRTFTVLQSDDSGSPAVDMMITYVCEEVN